MVAIFVRILFRKFQRYLTLCHLYQIQPVRILFRKFQRGEGEINRIFEMKLESYLESFKAFLLFSFPRPVLKLESYLESFKAAQYSRKRFLGTELESYLESFKDGNSHIKYRRHSGLESYLESFKVLLNEYIYITFVS